MIKAHVGLTIRLKSQQFNPLWEFFYRQKVQLERTCPGLNIVIEPPSEVGSWDKSIISIQAKSGASFRSLPVRQTDSRLEKGSPVVSPDIGSELPSFVFVSRGYWINGVDARDKRVTCSQS
jgi:hypothetical protein